MTNPLEKSFRDWESNTFGFGYGSGEPSIIHALKIFLSLCTDDGYDYQTIEAAIGVTVTWLLINALCRHGVNVIEYGVSPRYGWLNEHGKRLRDFIAEHSEEDLVNIICNRTQDDIVCYSDACNCGPRGYEKGRVCPNPFWESRK